MASCAVKPRALLVRILSGHTRNVAFRDLRKLAEAFGFHLSRVEGSHHIFSHDALDELLNLQEVSGEAKPYQIRQLLALVERYALKLEGKE